MESLNQDKDTLHGVERRAMEMMVGLEKVFDTEGHKELSMSGPT